MRSDGYFGVQRPMHRAAVRDFFHADSLLVIERPDQLQFAIDTVQVAFPGFTLLAIRNYSPHYQIYILNF